MPVNGMPMRLLSTGSAMGLAQIVFCSSVQMRAGVWLRTGMVLEKMSLVGKQQHTLEEVASLVSMASPARRKLTDQTSFDASGSEITADSEISISEAQSTDLDDTARSDDVPDHTAVTHVELGSVEAIKLVIEGTKAVNIGRVMNFEQFSSAVKSTLFIVDALLMDLRKAHRFISGDIVNNLKKMQKAMECTNTSCAEDMVLNEIQMGIKYKNSGREAFLWLKRSLVFIYTASKYTACYPEYSIQKCVRDAYNDTLAPCHGFKAHAVRFMMNGVPERKTFLSRLGHEENEVQNDLRVWLNDLRPILEHITHFCTSNRLEKVSKCQKL